ncbi:MAG: YbaB/EbfC family nucleoid-associated protein [Candidatus Paracaedibacteraceae bacterium]|nr:YbaB/EbfC family nucleoid-associated protein [Candidatus Paracaedibacteraceae bacterium]
MRGINQMLQQAQKLQKQMDDMQKQLESTEVEGGSGGGMVKVVVTGKGDLKKIKIDPSLVDPNDIEILEDLIIAAMHDAKTRADAQSTSEMSKLTGGLSLPGGMKLPF